MDEPCVSTQCEHSDATDGPFEDSTRPANKQSRNGDVAETDAQPNIVAQTLQRQYGPTSLSDQANAQFGDIVYGQHHHYYNSHISNDNERENETYSQILKAITLILLKPALPQVSILTQSRIMTPIEYYRLK